MYVLQDETSISHSEIFGEEITYTEVITEKRDNRLLNYLLGERRREVNKVGRGLGMRAQTLQTYIDLMHEHSKRVENQRERSKMKQKKKRKM